MLRHYSLHLCCTVPVFSPVSNIATVRGRIIPVRVLLVLPPSRRSFGGGREFNARPSDQGPGRLSWLIPGVLALSSFVWRLHYAGSTN
jgi:hypothetical protein